MARLRHTQAVTSTRPTDETDGPGAVREDRATGEPLRDDRATGEPVRDARTTGEPVREDRASGEPLTRERAVEPTRETAPAGAGTTGAAPSRFAMPRSRGAATGFLVFLLGLWGAIVPFIGPWFHYAFINYNAFSLPTWGRIWLSVLPGALAMLAGLELMGSAHRASAAMAAMLVGIAGGWFIVGPTVSMLWNNGVPQTGAALGGNVLRTIEWLGYYYALGGVLMWLGGVAFGRFSVRTVRDERALAGPDARV